MVDAAVVMRRRILQAADRVMLAMMMAGVAFVMEKALDRMTEPRPDNTESRLGRGLMRRLLPSFSAHLQNQHSRQRGPDAA
jgi:hypothetical protein